MPRVVFSQAAIRDLSRLSTFLEGKSPSAAQRASKAIVEGVEDLELFPSMGRLIEGLPEQYREWLIGFGDSGYVVRYHIGEEKVVILRVRHQKEASF